MAVQGEEHRDSVSSPCVSRSSAPRRPTPTVSTCKNTRRYNRCNRHPAAAVVARTIRIFHLRTPGHTAADPNYASSTLTRASTGVTLPRI